MARRALVIGPEPWAGALAGELRQRGADVAVSATAPASNGGPSGPGPDLVVASAAIGPGVWNVAEALKREPAHAPVLVLVGPRDMGGAFARHAPLRARADAYVPDDREPPRLAELALATEPGRAKPVRSAWEWAHLAAMSAIASTLIITLPAPVEWALLGLGFALLVAALAKGRAPPPWS